MFTFLGIGCVIVGHSDYSAVILHDNRRELHGDVEFMQKGDEEVEFFCEGEDCAGLCIGGGCGDGGLLDSAIVEGSGGSV